MLVVAAGSPGCVFDSDSDGGGGGGLAESSSAADDESEGPDTGSMSGAGQGSASPSDSSASEVTGDAPGSSGAAPSDGPDPTPGQGQAQLEFVDGPSLSLGEQELDAAASIVLTIENNGDAAADIQEGSVPDPPLVWAAGEFPGVDGTCGGLLPPGGTCEVTIAVGPGEPGLFVSAMGVVYDDGVGEALATINVSLTTVGRGANLLVNPGAEDDPPGGAISGWTKGTGDFRIDDDCSHDGGSVCFFAGESGRSVLLQDIDVSNRVASIDELGLGIEFEAWTRSRSWNNDAHRVRLVFFDEVDTELGASDRGDMDHTGWEATRFSPPVPAGTRRIRVHLECERFWGSACSAWFDDFSAHLVYPPPS